MMKQNYKSKFFFAVLLGFWAALSVWSLSPAMAGSGISLQMEPPSAVESKLYFTVTHPQNTSEIRLLSDANVLFSLKPAQGSVESTFTVEPDAKTHKYKAIAYGFESTLLGETNEIVFSGSHFLPANPTWNLTEDENIISNRLNLNGTVDYRATTVFLAINGKLAYRTTPKNGIYSFKKVALPKQNNWVQVIAENAWGRATTKTVLVDYFGISPKSKNYVVIDKSELCLFYVEGEKIVDIYPVAVGTPRTPTPEGAYIVGDKRVTDPNGDWGARRILLLSKGKGVKYIYAGYNVHGTNQPGSIGKMISHGCVRMFNEDVIALYDRVGKGFEVYVVQ